MGLRSLQWRLVFIFISITLSLMIFIGVILNNRVEASYFKKFRDDIENSITNYGLKSDLVVDWSYIMDRLDDKNFYPVKGDYRSYSIIDIDTSIIVRSSDRRYSPGDEKFKDEILKSVNVVSAMATGSGNEGKLTRIGDSQYFDCAYKVGKYVVVFMLDKKELENLISDFNFIIFYGSVLSVIVSVIIGYILARTITVPLGNIMQKAQKLAQGDFDQFVEVKLHDEIGKLTSTFNYMAGELKNKIIEISSEKNKVETILNYMTDGVIAFNLRGEVIHANPAFKKIVQLKEVNYSFDEFSREYDIGVSIEEIFIDGSQIFKEKIIAVKDKILRVHFALFTDEEKKVEGLIAVLQDITEQQKLENMRREFVANVSHELRTPLTSIKSYAETLLDGAMEDKDTASKFLSVINSEADRMTRLVKDLLQLTRLDNKQFQWKKDNISLVELVKWCVEKLQFEAKNKGQLLEYFVISDAPEVAADGDRIEQVILNIITNAIKYTPEGGKVTVYVGKTYDEAYVKVVDTGIGIPKEDLPRICERFYRVDKARSREMGGTGLGLAIAKEITEAHGGSISIDSEWGKGTEVTVKLPICNSILNAM